jgi:hypothetical protein
MIRPDLFITGDYKTHEDIIFERLSVSGKLTSSMGKVKVQNGSLNQVKGRDGVSLTACAANRVSSSMGNITWRGWVDHPQSHDMRPSIVARYDVSLMNIHAKDLVSFRGRIGVIGGSADKVKARNGIELNDTAARTVKVPGGMLKIQCTAQEKKIYSYLKARDRAELIGIKAKEIIVSHGDLFLTSSIIERAECRQEVRCKDSSIDSLRINIDKKESGIVVLTESVITGSLTVKIIQNRASTRCDYSFEGVVLNPGEPLPDSVARIMNTFAAPGQQVSINSIEITKDKATGKYFPVAGVANVAKTNEVILELSEGTINGNIEFIGCTGKVVYLANAKLLGKVIGGS